MEKIKNLIGKEFTESLSSKSWKVKIDNVLVGDIVVPDKAGIIVQDNDKIYTSIVSDSYVFISHTELKEKFLNQLSQVYNGGLIEREEGVMRYRYSVILKDLIYNISDAPYEYPGQKIGDKIAPIITIRNSYNGKDRISIDFGIYRFFCNNILSKVFRAFFNASYIHRGEIKEDLNFNMPLIMEIVKLISENLKNLVEIKVDGKEIIKEYSEYIDNPFVYHYLNKIRKEYIEGEKSLWQIINEITYITTHKPKVKVNNKVRMLITSRQERKTISFLYNLLEKYLNNLYKELDTLLLGTDYDLDNQLEDENIEIELEALV